MRLRFVAEGYSADDPGVPPNKVIFDSDDIGTVAVVAAGSHLLETGSTPGNDSLQIAAWDLPFVPLCTFTFRIDNTSVAGWGITHTVAAGETSRAGTTKILVDQTGIFVRRVIPGNLPVVIGYTAFNLPV